MADELKVDEEEEEEDRFVLETCFSCGIEFLMTTGLFERRQKDHKTFWCPNGHQQFYPKPKEVVDQEVLKAKLEDKVATLKARVQRLESECTEWKDYATVMQDMSLRRLGWLRILCHRRKR
jgi:hypothetical protein